MSGSLAHWSPLQTLIVGVIGTCVAVVVWYAVFYRATHDEWVTVSNDLSAAHSDLDAARDRKRLADGRAVELDAEAAALARTRAASPGADGRGEDLLFTVPALASELGVIVDRWRPLADEPADALLWSPAQVDARGSWRALLALLTRLGEQPQVVAVDRLNVRAGTDGELELQLAIGVLRLREAAP
jgi:hypothetical protein